MPTTSWVAELDKKEHKNWVMVGCALNKSLISSPPLQSLPPCACMSGSPKCGTCVTWETELKRRHKSGRPKICWENSDRNQWRSPTGAWEIVKIFIPTLGTRKTYIIDAETTDIGGLLNLLEWCPFIHPPVSKTVLTSARDQCRNHWAHAPKQELQDADVNVILGHLNSLLSDPVFSSDKDVQNSFKDLRDLQTNGLVNILDSELKALRLLRQSLVEDLNKCGDELDDVQDKLGLLVVESKKIGEVQKDLLEVKEQGDLNREEIAKSREQLATEAKELEARLNEKISTVLSIIEDFNLQHNERDDLQGVCDLISEDVECLKSRVQSVAMELATMKSQASLLEHNLSNVSDQVATNATAISGLQKEVFEVKETLKPKPLQGQNIDDSEVICTAPARLPVFTGRETDLAWLRQNLTPQISHENIPGMSCCTKTVCGLGGCGKTSVAVEFDSLPRWRVLDKR